LYAKEHTATVFNSSKAKNLAHRIAKGEILVNLDADNWADDIDQPLRQAFAATNRTIFRAWNGKRDGSSGRIAIASTWFYGLGGYDESFYPVGYQDVDLVLRAVAAGLKKHSFTAGRTPIRNSARAKIISTGLSCGLPSMLKANRLLSAANLAKGDPIRNREGWGAGFVSVNFAPVSRLVPIRPVALTANQNSIESRGVDNPRFDCRMRSDRDIDRAIEIVRRQRR
jgi:hypothetical protein